jgi:hypothetical protein
VLSSWLTALMKTKFSSRSSCQSPEPAPHLLSFFPTFPSPFLISLPHPSSHLTDFRLPKSLMNYSFRLFQAFNHDTKNYPFCWERKKCFGYQQSWPGARQPLEQSPGISIPEVDIHLPALSHSGTQ